MSVGGRAGTRASLLKRGTWIAAALVLLALLLLLSGHWILGIIFGALAAGAVWLVLQLRSVR